MQGLIDEANKDDKAQLAKYLKLSPNLILTDYLRFWRVSKNEKGKITAVCQIRICTLDELANLTKTAKKEGVSKFLHEKQNELLDFFALFFNATPKPINTAAEFANALAIPTKFIRDELVMLRGNERINKLYDNFCKGLYEKLSFDDFCDNFAQTLVYSLFLAKFHKDLHFDNNLITLSNVTDFIPNSFALLNGFANELKTLTKISQLKWILEHILNIINNISIEDLLQEFNKHHKSTSLVDDKIYQNPTIHFYEHFMNKYNKELREERGVYYTNESIVSFIINSIDIILKQDLGFKNGLQEATQKKDQMRLLDFATGTGAFLLEAFNKAFSHYKNLRDINGKMPVEYNSKMSNLIHNFRAFEILIAPYAIAHLNLAIALKDKFYYTLKDDERLNIFLTNTLEDREMIEATLYEAKKEAEAANETKKSSILIITGNPPYSGKSANEGVYEDEVKSAYGLEPSLAALNEREKNVFATYLKNPYDTAKKREYQAVFNKHKLQNEKQVKWLLDDYVKFIRFAQSKIEHEEQGIIAIITNHGFLDNPTFRGMRFHLLNSFEKIYIVDLHGNIKKKEKAPDGGKDDNVFDIQQGVCISIFVKTSKKKEALAELFCYDLFGKRSEKYNFLLENDLNSLAWRKLNPQAPDYLFTPQNETLRAEYNKGWSVKDIFKVSGVGMVSGRDDLCFSKSDTQQSLQEFKERIAKFMELEAEAARKEFNLPQDSRDWKIQYAQKELRETNNNPSNYVKCHYRPFDIRYTYYTGKSKGFHCQPGGKIMKYFLVDKNQALLVSRQESVLGDESCNPNFISDKIVDLNLYRRGGEQVMPLYVKDETNAKQNATLFEDETPKGRVENFTEEFRAFVDAKYGERFSPEQILGYIYAVLYHKDYREKYLDFLKTDFPKIPFVQSKEKFLQLSELGAELIDLHLMRERERRENDERGYQHWFSHLSSSTQQFEFFTHFCNSNNNRSVLHFKSRLRDKLSHPALPLQLGLVCDRGCKLQKVDNFFVSENIIDLHLVGSGSCIFPLYTNQI